MLNDASGRRDEMTRRELAKRAAACAAVSGGLAGCGSRETVIVEDDLEAPFVSIEGVEKGAINSIDLVVKVERNACDYVQVMYSGEITDTKRMSTTDTTAVLDTSVDIQPATFDVIIIEGGELEGERVYDGEILAEAVFTVPADE